MIFVWPFKKKKPVPAVVEPQPCKHKWQDFPWIMSFYYDYGQQTLKVIINEPYVCIYCKERQDRVLTRDWYTGVDKEEIDRLMDKYREKFKDRVEPKAVVEDKINDYQMVDREWLEIANILRRSRM